MEFNSDDFFSPRRPLSVELVCNAEAFGTSATIAGTNTQFISSIPLLNPISNEYGGGDNNSKDDGFTDTFAFPMAEYAQSNNFIPLSLPTWNARYNTNSDDVTAHFTNMLETINSEQSHITMAAVMRSTHNGAFLMRTEVLILRHWAALNKWFRRQQFTGLFCPSGLVRIETMEIRSYPETDDVRWFRFDKDEFIHQSEMCTWMINHVLAILSVPCFIDTSTSTNANATCFLSNVMKSAYVKPGKFQKCSLQVDGITAFGYIPSDLFLLFVVAKKVATAANDTSTNSPVWGGITRALRASLCTTFEPLNSFHFRAYGEAPMENCAACTEAPCPTCLRLAKRMFSINKLARISVVAERVLAKLCWHIKRVENISPREANVAQCQCGAEIEETTDNLFKVTVREAFMNIDDPLKRIVYVCPHLAQKAKRHAFLYIECMRYVTPKTKAKAKTKTKKKAKAKVTRKRGNVLERDNDDLAHRKKRAKYAHVPQNTVPFTALTVTATATVTTTSGSALMAPPLPRRSPQEPLTLYLYDNAKYQKTDIHIQSIAQMYQQIVQRMNV